MTRRAKGAAILLAVALGALASAASATEGARVGPDSGEPVPRFMALRGDHVNGRRGPGTQHRIDWIYRTPGLPLLVTAESGPWRRVRDPDGAEVWMHSAYLESRRTIYVRGERLGSAALRQEPDADSRVIAYLERGVVGELAACRGEWRQLRVDNRRGWAEASDLWGAQSCAAEAQEE
ncbi:MAG: SH3 domain-containing protein [Hyphomonadaceae bacterium]